MQRALSGGQVVRSIYNSQQEILDAIRTLHCDGEQFDADLTYGAGAFYARDEVPPAYRMDIDPQVAHVVVGDCTQVPVGAEAFNSVVIDLPFLTYVRAARTGNGDMVMAKRFSGYWRYDELAAYYRATLQEAARILRHKGMLVFKCQDIIHNHSMHCTHCNVVAWATEVGFRLTDLFVLKAVHRLPSPNRRGVQKHARIFHSYFLVFQNWSRARR